MVRVYYGSINLVKEPDVFQKYFQKMNTQRRSKILRCKNEKDKRCSLLAGILLKYGLEQTGMNYDTLVFTENVHGKPLIENRKEIHFNISHSGDYVVCAISDKNVGVDIENSQRILFQKERGALDKVVKRCFSKEEYALYESSVQKEEPMKGAEIFLKVWTRKESYSKAAGIGLGMDFSKINVMSESLEQYFWSDWLTDGYYLTVCHEEGSNGGMLLQSVSIEDIM